MSKEANEGVIKFQLDFVQKPGLDEQILATLITWRTICHRLNLIGQCAERYDGLGFGNISQRYEPDNNSRYQNCFLISGTQTGKSETATANDFCLVTNSCSDLNTVTAEGPIKPSSEALTHGSVYDSDSEINFVIHIHSPEIWNCTAALGIPSVDKNIAYGTLEMAHAVKRLICSSTNNHNGIFSMLGHLDGVIAYGHSAEETGQLLVTTLANALAIKSIDGSKATHYP